MASDSRSLLVIDDEPLALSTFAEGLRRHGFAVREALDAGVAVELVKDEAPGLAIVDIRMPGRDGIDLARELKEKWSVPSLFLTAYTDQELVDKAVAAGGLGYLVKPVDVARAVPEIESCLARSREMQDARHQQEHLEHALAQKRTVSVAIGVIVERKGLSRDAAFEWLRHQARTRRVRMEELAEDICHNVEVLHQLLES